MSNEIAVPTPQQAPAEAGEQKPPDGVFVGRVKDDEGNINVHFEPVGNIEQLEIPAVLQLATKIAKARLGVD